VRGF